MRKKIVTLAAAKGIVFESAKKKESVLKNAIYHKSSKRLAAIDKTMTGIFLFSQQRRKNAEGVYQCPSPEKVSGKSILLIDDIVTTGATLSECAMTLKEAGCREVFAAAAASRQ